AGTFSLTSPTWLTPSIANFIPTTAAAIGVVATNKWNNNAVSDTMVAPSNAYSGAASTNPPPLTIQAGASGVTYSETVWMQVEGSTIAWAGTNAGSGISCLGWEDNV